MKSIKSTSSRKLQSSAKTDSRSKLKNQIKKVGKQSPKHKVSDDSQKGESDGDKKSPAKAKQKVVTVKKKVKNGSIKRKKTHDDEKVGDKNVVAKKRMASLNASAILSANYEIDNYAAKHESSSTETSDNDEDEDNEKDDVEPPTMKKEKKDVKMESEEVFLLLCYLFVPLFAQFVPAAAFRRVFSTCWNGNMKVL